MKEKYSDITGIILSGGSSSRMGTDKGLLKFGSKSLIERSASLMSRIFKNILISTNDSESYSFLSLPMVEDQYKGYGPVSGIHAALVESSTDKNFILSCDMPLISEEMIRYIVEHNSEKPISVPSASGRSQYLCGVYHKSLIDIIEKMIRDSSESEKNNGKSSVSVKQLIENAGADIIDAESLPFFNENIFFNMNTSQDFDFIKQKISE